MTIPPTLETDPIALVESLEPDALRAKLNELEDQRRAVSVLLRAALVRQRAARRRKTTETPPAAGGAS